MNMNELMRSLSAAGIVVLALGWLLRRLSALYARRAAAIAQRDKVVSVVAAAPVAGLSADEEAFIASIMDSDRRVKGPALLASHLWDLHRLVCALPRSAMPRALARLLGSGTNNPLEGLRRRDSRQLTLVYAFAVALRSRGFTLTRVADTFVFTTEELEVTAERRGALRITRRGSRKPGGPPEPAWVRGPARWPRWPLSRRITSEADRAARVPYALRRLLRERTAMAETPGAAGLFVHRLAAAAGPRTLTRAAVRRRVGPREVLRGCSAAQLALLICSRARVAGHPDPLLLAFDLEGFRGHVTADGLVRNDPWVVEHRSHRKVRAWRPERGFQLHRLRAVFGALVAGGAVEAMSGLLWLAALTAVLWLGLEWTRTYLGSLGDLKIASAIPRLVGVAVGAAYAVPYLPSVILAAIAAALGVQQVAAINWINVIAYLAFVVGLGGQVVLRRYLQWVRPVRSLMLLALPIALLGAALSSTVARTAAWIAVASAAASVGVLLKSEATVEQNALRGTSRQPLVGMNLAFIGTLGLLLIAPTVMPENGDPWLAGLAPERVVFIVLAVLSFAAWRLLPKVLEVKEGVWEDLQPPSLRDRGLWRAMALTSFTLAAQIPLLNQLNHIFGAHGSATPVLWSAVLNLSIIVTAAVMPLWDRFQRRYQRYAELVAVGMTLGATLVGLLSLVLGLHGAIWYVAISVATVVIDIGATFSWACAEAEALTNAEDVARAASVNALRYAAAVGVGAIGEVVVNSELWSVWVPALACSLAALACWFPDRYKGRHGKARTIRLGLPFATAGAHR